MIDLMFVDKLYTQGGSLADDTYRYDCMIVTWEFLGSRGIDKKRIEILKTIHYCFTSEISIPWEERKSSCNHNVNHATNLSKTFAKPSVFPDAVLRQRILVPAYS